MGEHLSANFWRRREKTARPQMSRIGVIKTIDTEACRLGRVVKNLNIVFWITSAFLRKTRGSGALDAYYRAATE
jgi:hypothetical protein